MENIVTYLIFQFSKKEEAQIRTWLDCGHFPNAIDRERHRIIVFNINRETMLGFVNQFHIHDWTFGQSAAQPDEYTELFRFYDSVLWENIAAYRFFSMGNDYKPFSTISDRYQTLSTGFMHDGYKAWRTRFYLSRGLLGLSAKTLKPSRYTSKRSGETKISELRSKLQEALDEASEEYALCFDPDAELVIRLWIDYDTYRKHIKRIYIGWMSDSDIYINCREFVSLLRSSGVESAIILHCLVTDEWIYNLKDCGIPLVFLDREITDDKISSVLTSNYQNMCMQIEYLIRTGHKRIAFIRGSYNYDDKQRYRAYVDTMKKHGLPVDNTMTAWGDFNYFTIKQQFSTYYPNFSNIPDAICCSNDNMAVACIEFFERIGLSIPEDISICGFDDLYYSSVSKIPLTTVKNPIREISKKAVDEAVRLLDEKARGKCEFVSSKLIIRDSTTDRNK